MIKTKEELKRLAKEYGIDEPGIVEDESGVAFYDHLTTLAMAKRLGLRSIMVGEPQPWGEGGWMVKATATGVGPDGIILSMEAWGKADRTNVSKEAAEKGIILDIAEKRARQKALYLLYPDIFNPPPATPAQKRKIHALGKSLGIDHEALKTRYGIATFTQLTSWRAEEIINDLEWHAEMAAAPAE
jgi:hypothetical protein